MDSIAYPDVFDRPYGIDNSVAHLRWIELPTRFYGGKHGRVKVAVITLCTDGRSVPALPKGSRCNVDCNPSEVACVTCPAGSNSLTQHAHRLRNQAIDESVFTGSRVLAELLRTFNRNFISSSDGLPSAARDPPLPFASRRQMSAVLPHTGRSRTPRDPPVVGHCG
jgi:hypothetical protein